MSVPEALALAALSLSPQMDKAEAMEIGTAVYSHSKIEHVDPWTLLALGWEESRLKRDARNPKTGCLGYWQIAPANYKQLTELLGADDKVLTAWNNARIAAKLLRSYWNRCGSTAKALGRYGARAGQCRDTARARRILRLRDRLEREFGRRAA